MALLALESVRSMLIKHITNLLMAAKFELETYRNFD